MLDLVQIGLKMTDLRKKSQLTQDEISEKCLVSHQAISRWETGRSLPSIDNLCVLSDLYNVPIEELLCLTSVTESNTLDTLFAHHSRDWIIHEVCLNQLEQFAFTDIIHLLSKEERDYALYLLIEHQIPTDETLWPRLSLQERFRLLNQYLNQNYPLIVSRIYHLLSSGERKMIQGGKK